MVFELAHPYLCTARLSISVLAVLFDLYGPELNARAQALYAEQSVVSSGKRIYGSRAGKAA